MIKKGCKIAKDARLALEQKTGRKVITNENSLPPTKEKVKVADIAINLMTIELNQEPRFESVKNVDTVSHAIFCQTMWLTSNHFKLFSVKNKYY